MRISCPGCGAAMDRMEVCAACGFDPAAVTCFADQTALHIWQSIFVPPRPTAEKLLIPSLQKLAVLDPRNHTLTLYNQFERERVLQGVRQFSMSDSHWAAAFMDGHAEAAGDDSFQQCAVDSLSGVTCVHAMDKATCLIRDGRVTVRGYTPFEQALSLWTDVTQLASGAAHIAGLRRDGTVLIASAAQADECFRAGRRLSETGGVCTCLAPDAWQGVIAIEAGEGYLLGLTAEGRVLALGSINGEPLQPDWHEPIVSIAAARDYALGLTASGRLLATGKPRSRFGAKLDAETQGWRDLIAVGADSSVATGLDAAGQLHIAGKPAYRDLPDAPYWDSESQN